MKKIKFLFVMMTMMMFAVSVNAQRTHYSPRSHNNSHQHTQVNRPRFNNNAGYNYRNNTSSRSYAPVNTYNSYNNSSSSDTYNITPKTKHTCNACNGTGRIKKSIHDYGFTMDTEKVKCDECGEMMFKQGGHTHVTCHACNGKGYWE